MKIEGWSYYNHAVLPTGAPHEEPNLEPIKSGRVWKISGKGIPLLARWTTKFDCGYETEWWYVIKDNVFDIESIKAKRRYEIKKGKKNFVVRRINPQEYIEDLFRVQVAAFSEYPEKYRPKVKYEEFVKAIEKMKDSLVWGAFDLERNQLQGYAVVKDEGSWAGFHILKTNPEYERLAINAAIVAQILEDYEERLEAGIYICDGSRAIFHQTSFQEYLEKYFGFRKAYCELQIKYRFPVNLVVKILFPFRKYIGRESKLAGQITGILLLEEIRRGCIKNKV